MDVILLGHSFVCSFDDHIRNLLMDLAPGHYDRELAIQLKVDDNVHRIFCFGKSKSILDSFLVPDFILTNFLHPKLFLLEFGTNDIAQNRGIGIDSTVEGLIKFAEALNSRYNTI